MSIICKIDNTEHESREAFHKYLRKIKIKQEDYYTQYETRRDKFTGNPLPFKCVDQYLATEFESRDTLRQWIKANPEAGRKWSTEWLKKRKEEKGLIYPPTQVELESLLCPTKRYYDYIGGYNKICEELGYIIRYKQDILDQSYLPEGATIIEDTREQKPIELNVPIIREKLPYGDYGLTQAHSSDIFIERKSGADLVGTMSSRIISKGFGEDSNFARFSRELGRAKETGSYIITLVEEPIDWILDRNNCIYSKMKAGPDHVFHNIRELYHQFDNFQILFLCGRKEMARAIVKLLGYGESVKRVDLQYLYECKKLTF